MAKNGPELQCKNANGGEEDGRGNVYTGRAGYTFSHKPRNFAQYVLKLIYTIAIFLCLCVMVMIMYLIEWCIGVL